MCRLFLLLLSPFFRFSEGGGCNWLVSIVLQVHKILCAMIDAASGAERRGNDGYESTRTAI
jgi:hypothetical protein